MTKPWRIHDDTLSEIDATVDRYEASRDGLDLEWLLEVRATLRELRAAPSISTPNAAAPREANVRHRGVERFPYVVVFAESTAEYVVIAVAHLRREPGYWLERLDI